MKKYFVFLCCLCISTQAYGGNFQTVQKTYYNEDGTYSIATLRPGRLTGGANGPGWYRINAYDQNGKSIAGKGHDFNYITYDDNGEVIAEYKYYAGRVTYVLDKEDHIVALKSSWDGPVVETYQYTDTGKFLAYDDTGHLKGAYESFMDCHVATNGGYDTYSKTHTGFSQYVGNLSLLDEDGSFSERDENGNLLAVYAPDGSFNKYVYDSGGNLVRQTNSEGQIVWSKKIYTVEEAMKATEKGTKFHVFLTYK